MWDLLSQTKVQAALAAVSLLLVLFVAYRVIEALRPSTSKDDTIDRDLSLDFEEMRLGGDINEEELRSIKAVLEKTHDKR
jgi:uncharacterized membrane protein